MDTSKATARAFVAGALADGWVTAEFRDHRVARGRRLLTRRSSAALGGLAKHGE